MIDRAELKSLAKEQIKGQLGMLFVCSLIFVAVSVLLNMIPVLGSIAAALATPTVIVGVCLIYLKLVQGEGVKIETLFTYKNIFLKCFVLNFLVSLFVSLWSLLLFVPGIIKGISYSMCNYIMAEHPEMSASEAINESKRIMDGHKMEYFMLSLSFIGWMALTGITFGIAGIYTVPYMSATMANFYNRIKVTVV